LVGASGNKVATISDFAGPTGGASEARQTSSANNA